MRIAFTVHKYPPDSLGGTEIYTWSLARALAAAGHQVHVFYPFAGDPSAPSRPPGQLNGIEPVRSPLSGSGGLTLKEDDRLKPQFQPLGSFLQGPDAPRRRELSVMQGEGGVRLWRVPLPAGRTTENPAAQYWHTFRDTAIEAKFRRFLAEAQPEIVHFQHVQGVSARLIPLAAGRPRVLTLHDYWYFCANSQLVRPDRSVCSGPGWGWKCVDCATARADLRILQLARPLVALPFAYRNAYLRRIVRGIDHFIAPSHFLAEQYVRQGFPADRITVLENGLDATRLAGTGMGPLTPPLGRPHFGFLGSLAWQKGVHVLVDAFNRLPTGPGLTIYGSDAVFPDYATQVKASARHPGIRFAGALDYRSVGAALRQLDCLVVPSVWYENSPLVIQEAYAVGLPVVASRLGALTEKVQDGVTGRLFAPGDSADLARVLGDLAAGPEQLAALRTHIRPGPTMAEHAQQVSALYRRLVGKRPQAR